MRRSTRQRKSRSLRNKNKKSYRRKSLKKSIRYKKKKSKKFSRRRSKYDGMENERNLELLADLSSKKPDIPILPHTREKRFKCDEPGCLYSADSKWKFDLHKRTHTAGEKLCKCDESGCQYSSNYENHMFVHKH